MKRNSRIPSRNTGWLIPCGCVLAIGVVVALLWWSRLGASGRGDEHAPSASSSSSEKVTALRILRETLSAYAHASTYQDHAEILLRYPIDQQWFEEMITVSVAWQRPNRLRLEVSRGESEITLVCNGSTISCQVRDATIDNFDRQFVERSAPEQLTLPLIYSATEYIDPSRPSELLSVLMGLPVQIEMTPLGLLLSREPLEQLIKTSANMMLLSDQSLEECDCHRVQIKVARGHLVFWIDRDTRLLRRVEYPIPDDSLSAGKQNADPNVTLVGDFLGAHLGRIDARQFELEKPEGAKVLRHFVLPPTAHPSSILGQRVDDYAFTGVDGKKIDARLWNDKLAVLIWYQDHPASRAALEQLVPVRNQFKDDDRLTFLAICTEPTTSMSHEQVEKLARNWSVEMPIARDLDAHGRDVFHIDKAPTLVIVAADGVVQMVEEGVDSDLGQHLPIILQRLLDGEDLAGDFLRFAQQQQRDYQRHLAAASVDAPTVEFELPETKIVKRSDPARLRITSLWTCRELSSPGNILTIRDTSNEPLIYVVDGWREIGQIDTNGKLRERF